MVVLISSFLAGFLGGLLGSRVGQSKQGFSHSEVVTIKTGEVKYFELESNTTTTLEYSVESLSDHFVNGFVMNAARLDEFLDQPGTTQMTKSGGDALRVVEASRDLTLHPGQYILAIEVSSPAGVPDGERQPPGDATVRVGYSMKPR
jgi:hypothetical protein